MMHPPSSHTVITSSKGEEEDMISKLPDFIIGYILSFLSTKEAVLTSVLSKRWKYMWTFQTKLNFVDYTKNSATDLSNKLNSFSNFVSRVLFHLDRATIQEFSLYMSENYDPYYINQWISSVLNRRVKKFKVILVNNRSNLSSFPLFECQSLEELVFKMQHPASCIIKVPSFVCLSSLTVLNLAGRITFTSYSSNKLEDLTLNFPLLREYKANGCIFSGVKNITIEAPLLELIEIFNVNSRNIIRFSASRITNFTYAGPIMWHTISLDHHQYIPSKIILIPHHSKDHSFEELSIFIGRLLSCFINAEYLEINLSFSSQGLALVKHLFGISAFRMLDYLKLDRVTGDALFDFLLKSPCLKTLILQMVDFDEESQTFATVPDCFVSTLKVVKFDKYFGGERELSFAKFVMENAKVLERISFSFHESCSEVEKAKEKLSLVKISFSTVIMEFST